MSVEILMNTYNGEQYLRNQLLSPSAAYLCRMDLWVHDDGSILRNSEEFDSFGYQMEGSSRRLMLSRIEEYRRKYYALS